MRVPVRRSRSGDPVRFRALAALGLLLGILAPLAPLAPAVPVALAAQRGDPPPLPAPSRVAVVGSFQTALGCPQDYDASCSLTALADGGDGIWTGTLPIPPGEYAFRISSASDAQRSLGAGGDPDGGDLALSVPADAAGAYFAYDPRTGAITGEPVEQRASLVTDLGDRVDLAPTGAGYEAYFDAQPGSYGFQILFDDVPVGQDTIALDAPSRVYVAVDAQGAVTVTDTVADTRLDVAKTDAAGVPQAGACFAVRTRDGALVGQGCDGDDGAADGQTSLRVPNGLAPDTYELDESLTPDGQEPAARQRLDLGPGGYAAEAVAGGEAAPADGQADEDPETIGPEETSAADETSGGDAEEATTADPTAAGRVVLRPTDEEGEALPGACFVLVELGVERCDDDADGDVLFDDVPVGAYTLAQTATPDGYQAAPDSPIEVGADGARLRVPLAPVDGGRGDVSAIATEEATAAAREETADGDPDEAATATATTGADDDRPGTLVILVVDDEETPVGETCFALDGENADFDDVCDQGNDGRLNLPDIAPGTYLVRQLRTAPGHEPAGEETVTVPAGGTEELTVVNPRTDADPDATATETPEADAATGAVAVAVADAAGEPAVGGCYGLAGAPLDPVCDGGPADADADPGRVLIEGVPPGDYDLFESQAPVGAEPALAPEPVAVVAGKTARVRFAAQDVPSPEPTAEPTADNAEATAIRSTAAGRVVVVARPQDGVEAGGLCVALAAVDEDTVGPVCDGERADGDGADGRVALADVAPGDYRLRVDAPAEVAPVDEQEIAVAAGETTRVEVALAPAATTPTVAADESGTLILLAEDAAGQPLPGACYTVANGGQTFGPFCDENANGDVIVTGVSPGAQTVVQTTAPEGAPPPADAERTATVDPGEATTVAFAPDAAPRETPGAATGAVRVTLEADGDPLAGACVELAGEEATIGPVCDAGVAAAAGWRFAAAQDAPTDADPTDADPLGGRILIEDVLVGDYALSVVDAPDGFAAPRPIEVAVAAGETAEAAVALQPDAPADDAPGRLTISTEDEAGEPLGFACYTLTNPNGVFGPYCDDDGDGDVELTDLIPGRKTIAQQRPPTDAGPPADAEQAVTIEPGGDEALTFVNGPALGSVRITAADAAGDPAANGCYEVTGPQNAAVCDNGEGDADPDPGVVLLAGLEPGDYAVAETEAPDGVAPVEENQDATVALGETAEVAFAAAAIERTGGVEVTLVDAAGETVGTQPGACFGLSGAAEVAPVCDDAAGDANPAAGVVRIDELAPGAYTLSQTRATEDAVAAADVAVRVAADEVTAVAVEVVADAPAAGTLTVVNLDPDGGVLAGGCFAAAGPEEFEICDNGADDADPDPGEVSFDGIAAGTYAVSQTAPAAGFAAAPEREVEVAAGEETTVELLSEPAAPGTGGLLLQAQDADGAPVPGQCFRLEAGGETVGTFCDNGPEDADPAPGALVVEGLAEGVYEAVAVSAVDAVDGPAEGEEPSSEVVSSAQSVGGAERRTVTVRRDRAPIAVTVVVVAQPATTGDLVVGKRDEADRALAGACFALLDAVGETVEEVCDGRGGDGDGNRGQVRFDAVPAGDYTLSETAAPPGYAAAADQPVTVRAGRVARLAVPNEPLPSTGTLTVTTTDGAGDALLGACYALLRGTGALGPVCDAADGAVDGQTAFADLAGGAYVLQQTQAPSPDYAPADDRALQIVAGADQAEEVVNAARPGTVLIAKVDEAGTPLGGACFALAVADAAADGGDGYALCDDDANDADPTPGTILLPGVAAADYTASETRAPAGYRAAADQALTVAPNRQAELVFANAALPPPPRTGDLLVFKVDEGDQALPGACFALLDGETIVAGPLCDADDGSEDGTIAFEGVGVGDYALRETRRPAAGYAPIADLPVTIALNETTEVAVENRLRPGRLTVRKTDVNGNPLADACFDLEPDGLGPLCTDAAGLLTFEAVAPGTYDVTETTAPEGYLAADPLSGVVVNPGATTTLDVVNALAPPPPDTGSIQVVKFFCPAGDGGEGTEFVDSSDPGGSRLARTAGCAPGDAAFALVAASGEGGPGELATGDDGRYQTTLLAGDYTLQELAADGSVAATEEVTISVGQLTTVVVLDFVAPPAPAPAAIDVAAYTCAPGFQGTVYADFVDLCAAPENLANNVTFRLAGTLTARAVTGDGGFQGETGFEELPAGDYVLRQQVPATAAQTVFAFCGRDPDAPDRRRVGATIALRLAAGERQTCAFFTVPDDLPATTGAILVQKYGCPVTAPPAGFDWYDECAPQGAGVPFSLALLDGGDDIPVTDGVTDGDGLLRFDGLEPGTYRLEEVGAAWCHAESDSVNARGDVVVRAGERASVFAFNCLGTKRPPNTGAGPGAWPGASPAAAPAVVGPTRPVAAGVPGTAALLGVVWPLLGLAALTARRRRAA